MICAGILEGACSGDWVIIRFSEGVRAEVRFLYEIGFPDLKSIVKDFHTIRQYNLQVEQIGELRDQAAELLKDHPDKRLEFDKYINQDFWVKTCFSFDWIQEKWLNMVVYILRIQGITMSDINNIPQTKKGSVPFLIWAEMRFTPIT